MIQAAIAAAVRDASPDSAAAEGTPAVPPAGPGHAPAAPAERVASVQSSAAPAAPTLDNVAQYVVRSVRLMVHDGQKTLTVRLIPPSLGELHLEITSVRDNLQVRLMSANPVVRDALESQLTSLRDTLARSGVEASSVTVASGSTSGQASHNLLSGGRQDGGSAPFDPQSGSGQDPAAGQESSRRSTGHQGLIDVFV
jgi:flagellar hook-length control protein FliK